MVTKRKPARLVCRAGKEMLKMQADFTPYLVATMPPSLTGPVIENTFLLTGKTAPKVRFRHARSPSDFGVDGPFREAGRTALTSVFNICPTVRLKTQVEPTDSLTEHDMATAKSPTTPTQGNTHHDNHQAELLFRASNHLALALFLLRNASGESSIKTATDQANAAARALNQLPGGAHHG